MCFLKTANMKRLLFVLCATLMAVCCMQAGQVSESDARQVANRFFSQTASRFTSPSAPSATRLAFTAERNRFYVYDRGTLGGFVIVAGDDRLPQVLGYGNAGDFSAPSLPPAVQYWMDELNRQIAYLQDHAGVAVHRPAKRETIVEPMVTTQWNQSEPYNNYCPTYTVNGNEIRSASGCVATATTQVMKYYNWPAVGRGSHSYFCNVNGTDLTELSVDFSQSVYRWDLMLDTYDSNSSEESCDAVAKLMYEVGVGMEMGYGESSGASEYEAAYALMQYFGYGSKYYWLSRNYYNADEWDQFLADEISLMHPVMYCGYSKDAGHAFVLDGFDADGLFHVNWGWGGYYDGYFLASLLAPTSGMNFKYYQDALFGMVPETQADEVQEVLHVRGQMLPVTSSALLGTEIAINAEDLVAEGNALDTVGFEEWDGNKLYYAEIPMKLGLYDNNGVELKSEQFIFRQSLDRYWWMPGRDVHFGLPESLDEGEYQFKLFYAEDDSETCDHPVLDFSAKEMYIKMIVQGDTAYFKDVFLYNTYSVESFDVPRGVRVNEKFKIGVDLSYSSWFEEDGPTGNVYLALRKDGEDIATSPMYEVTVPANEMKTYEIELTAPSEWGFYEVALFDESGNQFKKMEEWYNVFGQLSDRICILPICDELFEDFETMPANNSTNSQNVDGRFTTWNFGKSGVRAPGEGKCNGAHSVMMKNPSLFYTAQPMYHNFFMAQMTIFNSSAMPTKYRLEYSTDGGANWEMAYTIDDIGEVEVERKSELFVTWNLNLTADQPVQFRVAMVGGGNGATYVDDLVFYYLDKIRGDVNGDGEVNIADVNEVIKVILADLENEAADVNGDGEVNIADVNVIIGIILGN